MSRDSSHDPRTGEVVTTLDHTSPDQLESAVVRSREAARMAAAASPRERGIWLHAAAAALEAHLDELAALADTETALGRTRLDGEVVRTANQARFYASVATDGSYLNATVDHGPPQLARVNVPLGSVAVFGASNFPFAFSVFGNDTASAIAAGCSVVAKAHPAHLGVSQRVAHIVSEAMTAAGAPVGLLELVVGFEAGRGLVAHPDIAAVGFTGSESGGLALWRAANAREIPIPVYAEMGTVNPVVVTPGAAEDFDGIAAGFVGSFTMGHGQFCTKPGIMFVPAGNDAPARVAKALEVVAPSPLMLTAGIAHAVNAGLDELVEAGATVVTRTPELRDGWSAPAAVLTAPIAQLVPGSRLLAECFGAVALVVEYADVDQVVATISGLQGALAASVMISSHDADASTLIAAVQPKVGRVVVNDWPTGVAFTWAQQHGGPWPATSNSAATSVGAAALDRFVRPVAFQGLPDELLPQALQVANPWNITRRIDGVLTVPEAP